MSNKGLAIFGVIVFILAFAFCATPLGSGFRQGVVQSEECQKDPDKIWCSIFGAGDD